MTTTPTTPNVPIPAGALRVADWHDVGTDGEARAFIGRSWVIDGGGWHKDDISVEIRGIQHPAGEVDRVIMVWCRRG